MARKPKEPGVTSVVLPDTPATLLGRRAPGLAPIEIAFVRQALSDPVVANGVEVLTPKQFEAYVDVVIRCRGVVRRKDGGEYEVVDARIERAKGDP